MMRRGEVTGDRDDAGKSNRPTIDVDDVLRDSEEREVVGFGSDSNDESDWIEDDRADDPSERDLFGRGRFDR